VTEEGPSTGVDGEGWGTADDATISVEVAAATGSTCLRRGAAVAKAARPTTKRVLNEENIVIFQRLKMRVGVGLTVVVEVGSR